MTHVPANEIEAVINHNGIAPIDPSIATMTVIDCTNPNYAVGVTENAPRLPARTDPYNVSVHSVWERGFHDFPPPAATNWRIMAQFTRLVEEIAEFTEANLWEPRSEKTQSEIADVLIVLSQLAWLTGMEPSQLAARPVVTNPLIETEPNKRNITIVLGSLARALRKMNQDTHAVHAAISSLAQQMHFRCKTAGFKDIEAVILAKCAADEQRGKLHGAA